MFSVLRNRLGIPGLISVIALVFAMGGGAYAANGDGAGASANNRKGGGNVNKLIKRESRKFSQRFSQVFSKRFAVPGPPGVPGLQGPQGVPGEDGDDGDDGSDGDNGKEGKEGKEGEEGPAGDSVTSTSFDGPEETPPNEGPCEGAGGTEFEIEGSGSPEFVCNGSGGEGGEGGGLPGTLPPEATLTGSWAPFVPGAGFGQPGGFEGAALVTMSFPLPVEPPPSFTYVTEEDENASGCPGVVNGVPQADPGNFCVYEAERAGSAVGPEVTAFNPSNPGGSPGVGPSGVIIEFTECEPFCEPRGTWAVTAAAAS